jgi:zinc/manganese transport system ATP-binding protein
MLGRRSIWHAADLTIAAGEFVALIGSNGTGKTTLLRVLLGQIKPRAGAVLLFGTPPRRGNTDIGYVPQRRTLDGDLALHGRDLVLLGLIGHRWGFGRATTAEQRIVAAALAAVGADRYADQPVGILSGGEVQRLLIAQALLTEPRLLLLDEPLASLDMRSQHEIVHLVDDLRRARGMTVVFVSHDLNPLLEVLDCVVSIEAGVVRGRSPDEVVLSEALSRLYGTAVHVHQTADGHRFVVGA